MSIIIQLRPCPRSYWTMGAFLSYSSGMPFRAPAANNALASSLFRGTFANRVPGVPLFTKDLNCHCIDPNKDFVLNPTAWTDPVAGQFGTSAAYYDDYHLRRRPVENLNLGRTFRIRADQTSDFRPDQQTYSQVRRHQFVGCRRSSVHRDHYRKIPVLSVNPIRGCDLGAAKLDLPLRVPHVRDID